MQRPGPQHFFLYNRFDLSYNQVMEDQAIVKYMRNFLAERGVEKTPDETEEMCQSCRKLFDIVGPETIYALDNFSADVRDIIALVWRLKYGEDTGTG